jgi:hypothetical protein
MSVARRCLAGVCSVVGRIVTLGAGIVTLGVGFVTLLALASGDDEFNNE